MKDDTWWSLSSYEQVKIGVPVDTLYTHTYGHSVYTQTIESEKNVEHVTRGSIKKHLYWKEP